MNRLILYLCTSISVLFAGACTQQSNEAVAGGFQEIDWLDLQPPQANPQRMSYRQGSLEVYDYTIGNQDTGNADPSNKYGGWPSRQIRENVVADMDGKQVRIPGYIVPLEYEAGNLLTEFLIVPTLGSCFHLPPPPPNQIIFVKSNKAVRFESIYDAVWVMGEMNTKQTGNEIATAAYSLDLHSLAPYVY